MSDQYSDALAKLGFVAIGRNEGERLQHALRAIRSLCPACPVVYVDSGSTDDSVVFAQSLNIDVVELDLSIPFTAARARNAGFKTLLEHNPTLAYVQFFDGDCTMVDGWTYSALSCLSHREDDVAIVSGRRKERYPERSIYNALMDIEWNTPVGETRAVLGDMCVKVDAFQAVDGFSETIIAAEDDDLCIRIRASTHKKVLRLDADMSLHDANITELSQWYRRAIRGGYGYANIHHVHGSGPEQYFKKELRSALLWGTGIPVLFLMSLICWPKFATLILFLYLSFIAKTALRLTLKGRNWRIACAYAGLVFSAKVPESFGIFKYWRNHLLSKKHQLIEYK